MTMLYSYIVRYDDGVAPNPFHKVCTLAICKPGIRRTAQKCDYVIGLAGGEYRRKASVDWPIVYAMQITEEPMTFEKYWHDPRYQVKRPDLNAGGEYACGDNIYHKDSQGQWVQESSWHSNPDGTPNQCNLETDTGGHHVLASEDFIYWGSEGPPLPSNLTTLIVGRNYKRFRTWVPGEQEVVEKFIEWFEGEKARGFKGRVGMPFDWEENAARCRTASPDS